MKRIIAGAAAALLSACTLLPTGSGTRSVRTEQEFTLREEGRAVVLGANLVVEFAGVTEDTRCAIEVYCIQAGNATVRLRAWQDGRDAETLDLRTDEPSSFGVYDQYAIELLALDPPASQNDPDPDYRVRLRVGPVATGSE
jgi:hypothetical protein